MMKWLKRIGIGFAALLLTAGLVVVILIQRSKYPPAMDMAMSGSMSMGGNMSVNTGGRSVSVTSLVQGPTNASTKTFTLVAENKTVQRAGQVVQALTFNGSSPGPTLVITQGDRLVVHLVNHASVGVTIHWHGVPVPNANDGVAGVTQNAVPPNGTYTYSFVVNKPGTYWYHSHQKSYEETIGGLFGVLVVKPKLSNIHYDHDYVATLHDWSRTIFTVNDTSEGAHFAAKPGDLIRLRIVNAGDYEHDMVLIGAPFRVVAIDANDINKPTDVNSEVLPIAPAQRWDIEFRMPSNGIAKLVDVDSGPVSKFIPDFSDANKMLTAIFGQGTIRTDEGNLRKLPVFDYSKYGTPLKDAVDWVKNAKYDVVYNMDLGNHLGFLNGTFTMKFTINGKTMESLPPLVVKEGDRVKIHIVNPTDIPHAMHLHGHDFLVLNQNGRAMQGSPIYLDTIEVKPHGTEDVAFIANNPGLWMFHCHMLIHAYNGMDMMVNYQGVTTPFRVGSKSGNFPD